MKIKRIYIIILCSILFLGCEKQKSVNILLGIWNFGKITDKHHPYTLLFNEKLYITKDGYLVFNKDTEYQGVIYDISENIYITEITGEYPTYKLIIKLIDLYYKNNKKIEKTYSGAVIVHFIDKNTIWFENLLSAELTNLLKIRYFSMEFGPDKLFYRAEQTDKPIQEQDRLE